MDVVGGFVLYGLLVASLYGLAVVAGWVDDWWRARRADRAMRRVSARLRCTVACRGEHTYVWPCERAPLADRRGVVR